jgi:hypothetical protein
MWVAVAVFNPFLTFAAVSITSLETIHKDGDTIIAHLGRVTVGEHFASWIAIDAFFVLSGGLITSFVGVTGLMRRLAGDRCLPNVLLATNRLRGTNHWIILVFWAICCSMFVLLRGEVVTLAGVYTIAFLTVMAMFGVGDMLIKYKRGIIARAVYASWPSVTTAVLLVMVALIGTVVRAPDVLDYFVLYFFVSASIFFLTFYRVRALRVLLFLTDKKRFPRLANALAMALRRVTNSSVAFFSRTDRIDVMNKALLYIRANEQTHWVRVIHVARSPEEVPPRFFECVRLLDTMYPKIRIDAVVVYGQFNREAIDACSRELDIPINMMFIAAPRDQRGDTSAVESERGQQQHEEEKEADAVRRIHREHDEPGRKEGGFFGAPHMTAKLDDLGGVRIITH